MALNLGGVIRLTCAVRNDAGTLVNPGAATLTITQPDGTTASPTVSLPPAVTGQLVVDFAPVQAGLHSVDWATTNPITSEDDVFVVERPAAMLVSVDEAVAHLRSSNVTTSDADREQLQWLCIVATDAVERDLGRVLIRRTVVETYDGDSWAPISLRSTPVISITSVVEAGVTLTGVEYFADFRRGWLHRGTTTSSYPWAPGLQVVVVTYVAGYANPPAIARKAALNAIQAMWQTSQQASHPLINEELALAAPAGALEGLTPLEVRAYSSLRAVGV